LKRNYYNVNSRSCHSYFTMNRAATPSASGRKVAVYQNPYLGGKFSRDWLPRWDILSAVFQAMVETNWRTVRLNYNGPIDDLSATVDLLFNYLKLQFVWRDKSVDWMLDPPSKLGLNMTLTEFW